MPHQISSLIATPILTGVVGYVTNWLAIKMLFRPHTKKWYSMGWVGVIPKKREKLAKEVAEMVGRKLLSPDDILGSIKNKSVQKALEKTVEKALTDFLKKDFGTVEEIVDNTGINLNLLSYLIYRTLRGSKKIESIMDGVIDNFTSEIMNVQLKSFIKDDESLSGNIIELINKFKFPDAVTSEIDSRINNFILSGKSLKSIVPNSLNPVIDKAADGISTYVLDSLKEALETEEVKKALVKKVLKVKDDYFSSGSIDQIKLGFINMFVSDDTVTAVVDKHFPAIIDGLVKDEKVRKKFSDAVRAKIDGVIEKPVFTFADNVGIDKVFEIRSGLLGKIRELIESDQFINVVKNRIEQFITINKEVTIGDVIKLLTDEDSKDFVKDMFKSKSFREGILSILPELVKKIIAPIRVRNLSEQIPKSVLNNVRESLTNKVVSVVEDNIGEIFERINLKGITENKINSLDLYEVEDLLFSFMRDQFKWINYLGFLLGFAFGAVQSLIFYFI